MLTQKTDLGHTETPMWQGQLAVHKVHAPLPKSVNGRQLSNQGRYFSCLHPGRARRLIPIHGIGVKVVWVTSEPRLFFFFLKKAVPTPFSPLIIGRIQGAPKFSAGPLMEGTQAPETLCGAELPHPLTRYSCTQAFCECK